MEENGITLPTGSVRTGDRTPLMAATFNLLPVRVITPRPNGYLRSALTR